MARKRLSAQIHLQNWNQVSTVKVWYGPILIPVYVYVRIGDVSGVVPGPIPMTVGSDGTGEDQNPIPMLTSSTVLDDGSKNN